MKSGRTSWWRRLDGDGARNHRSLNGSPLGAIRARITGALSASVLLVLAFGLGCPGAGRAWAKDEVQLPKDLPPYGQDRPLPVARITQTELGNGMRVWLSPREGLPKLVAVLVVRGGTSADPAEMLGMSQILADVLKEGTASRSAQAIAEEMQSVGGDLATSVNDDAFLLSVEGLSNGSALMLEVLADVAQRAAFPEGEVELAKDNAVQGLLTREARSNFLAERALADAIFGKHPYRLMAPERSVIQAITPEMLRAEFHRRFRPEQALLVLVGAFQEKAALKEIAASFGSWKGEGPAVPATPPAPRTAKREILLVNRPGSVQSEIRVGRPTVSPADPDYYPLLLANTVFGSSSTSRLYENIREDKGYTYTPWSSLSSFAQGGMVEAEAAVRNEVTGAAILEIAYEMDRMGVTTVPDDELSRAKRYQTGIYLLRNETRAGLAYTLAGNWADGLPAEALAEFVPRINEVTAAQVREIGRKYLAFRDQVVAVAGDAEAIRGDLEQFGPVEVVQP